MTTLYVICGAYAEPGYMHRLPDMVEARTLIRHLPQAPTSVEDFARTFDAELANLPAPRVVLGLSIGGLVAMALANAERLILVDPPLTTSGLWPLKLPDDEWSKAIFGKNYRHLLRGLKTPAEVVIAGEPLEPERPVATLPGLVSAEDRALYGEHPLCRVHLFHGVGHNIPRDASNALLSLIRRFTDQPLAQAG